MAKYRDNLDKKIVDQEEVELKYDYIDIDDAKSILDEVEKRVNECIKLFKVDTLSDCLYELERLSEDLY